MIISIIGDQRSTRMLCDFLEIMGVKLVYEEGRRKIIIANVYIAATMCQVPSSALYILVHLIFTNTES